MADPNDAYSPYPTDRPERPGWYDRFADLAQRAYGPLAWSTFPTTDQARVRLNSLSGGFGDELLGGLASLTGGDYAQTRDRERAGVRRAWDRDPGSAARETIYGTLPWFAAPASLAGQAAPWLGRLAGYAGMGGLQGGVSGFGEGEGGVGERARHAASGALTGAAMMGVPFLGYHAAKAFPAAAAGVAGGALGSLVPSEAQAGPVPRGFFSVLEEALRGSKAKSMPAEQWSAYLAPGRREVTMGDLKFPLRDEELKWSGLPGYLEGKEPGERISVDELLKQVDQRPLPEMKQPKGGWTHVDNVPEDNTALNLSMSFADRVARGDRNVYDRAMEAFDNRTGGGRTRVRELERVYGELTPEERRLIERGEVQITGGGQYKEHVLPGPTTGYGEELTKFRSSPPAKEVTQADIDAHRRQFMTDDLFNSMTEAQRQNTINGTREFLTKTTAPEYQSSHFGSEGQDLLSHSRWSRRRTDDGKPVHVVEEIQSDWHQQGREKGYALSPTEVEEFRRLGNQPEGSLSEADAAKYEDLFSRFHSTSPVPQAPFSKTYHELELKKNLARAVANGDEYLALTTGTQQADRWNQLLHKDLTAIHWRRDQDGRTSIYPDKGEGPRWDSASALDLQPDKLRAMVGKEMADKILKDPSTSGSLTGDNLSIGGGGMRHTYDEVYRGYLDKLAKQYGGEVTTVRVPYVAKDNAPVGFNVIQNEVNRLRGLRSRTTEQDQQIESMETELKRWYDKGKLTHEVPAIRITDKMHDRVKRHGLPLFSAPAATGAAGLTGYLGLRPPEDDLPN